MTGGWQKGDEAELRCVFRDAKTKAPIDWEATTAQVTVRPPGGAEAPVTSATAADGSVTALLFFNLAGVWRGHIILTGEHRRKVPFHVEVKDD